MSVPSDKTLAEESYKIYNKEDIKRIYGCENDKALRILKMLFQMGYGNKIGKEYYVSPEEHSRFLCDHAGVVVNI